MKYYVTIDGGTTNTRVNLVCDGKVIKSEKISIGARDCIDGNSKLKDAITEKIDYICLQNSIKPEDLTAIIASGMITCEYGLFTLPHLSAPVGIKELNEGIGVARGMLGGLDCHFIPGVKIKTDSPLSTDMMRGEETEIMGIYSPELENSVFILPGSHSKHIFLDKDGRIASFKTMMTGEMISALANGTILKGVIKLDLTSFDPTSLLQGYDAAEALGLNDALFKVRIMKNLFNKSDTECYSFFLGAVMHDEVSALKKASVERAVIGGKGQLRESLAHLLRERTSLNVLTLDDKIVENSVALGAVKIFEFNS